MNEIWKLIEGTDGKGGDANATNHQTTAETGGIPQ